MKLYSILCLCLALLFVGEAVYADWSTWTFVNQGTANIQASRDDDCPWSLACDSDGNTYMVWEDRRTNPMQIYMRRRNADGSWENNEKVSFEQDMNSSNHCGHPAVCILEVNDTTKIYVAYVDEWASPNPPADYRELKGSIFDGES